MTDKQKDERVKHILVTVEKCLIFFVIMGFVVSCCMTLFLNSMADVMGISFTRDNIQQAAKLTFANVILLSLICTAIDYLRRYFMVDKPVKKIIDAAKRITDGDLTVRIEKTNSLLPEYEFDRIIDYFNSMAEELSGMETLRTDFIANVSHELKTPLAVIQNYGTMLQEPKLSEEKRLEYARAITDSSRSLAHMISNILRLNKLENQKIYPEGETYNLGEQLCECLVGFEDVWDKKNIDIEADIEDDVMIKADYELLTLVWNNLFSNAVKFSDEGGKIKITLKRDGENVVVSVEDNGCGISPEVGTRIFEKFYQGDTSHKTKGNGLGLALVKRVIDITGGDISVSSSVGKGSIFTVTLKKVKNGTD
jgi:signal transduction histidine kinase